MKQSLRVIYITGVGDQNPVGQRRVVSLWRLWGVQPIFFQMNWADAESWEGKFERLLGEIDRLSTQGYQVGLVGISAGASAAINAFAARKDKISGVVLIAGKVNHPETIGSNYKDKNPALVDSVYGCVSALASLDTADRRRIQTRYALRDGIVPERDSRIPGARHRRVSSIGHVATIATQITFGAPGFLHFLKKLSRTHLA